MQRVAHIVENLANSGGVGVTKETERKSYYAKSDADRILEMLSSLTTEELFQYLQENGGDVPAHVDIVKESRYQTDLISLLERQEHVVIPHQAGEGATHFAAIFEAYERAVSNKNLVIPLDLSLLTNGSVEQMICQSMGRLVEVIEQFHDFYDRESMSGANSQFVLNYARVVKTGGRPMQSLLQKAVDYRSKANSAEGLQTLFPIAQRIQSRYVGTLQAETLSRSLGRSFLSLFTKNQGAVSTVREKAQFLRNVNRKVRSAKAIQTVPEMVQVVRSLLGEYSQNIYLIADVKNDKQAKRTVDVLTDSKLIAHLRELGVNLKVFAPESVRAKNTEVKVLDGVFAWSDELILQMINEKMRSTNTWMKLGTFQSEKTDLVPKILEYAQKNPRRAVEVTHALLAEVRTEDSGWTMGAQTWNNMCDNWKSSADRPKKIKE